MAFDAQAKSQIDAHEAQYNKFVSNATAKSNMKKMKNNFLRKLGDYRRDYLKQNWREPFLKTFKHPEDCNMVNYPSWHTHAYDGKLE